MPVIKREKWSQHFGKWFRKILTDAEIIDQRYPIKGMTVWLPYGFKIRGRMLQLLRVLHDSTGHQEMLFPLLIPETSLAKEAEHVKSFEGEVFWVTRGGLTPLEVKLALRPTSEAAIGPMLKLWVRSHADLPIRLYQIVNTFRYETRATRPLIRVREIDNFKEAHTAHATQKEAEAQVKQGIKIYKKFFDELAISYKITKRPDWDKFPGAEYTISFEQIMPDGRTLQIGTVHNLGQNFAKAFDITYETEKGERQHVWQTCYGISGRPIAGVLAMHGDDNGPVLPPAIAPVQVVIVPIPAKNMESEINEVCQNLASRLKKANINAEVDSREDLTPGSKFYYWELRGVPIRIEIGPRDLKQGVATVVRRDTLGKQAFKMVTIIDDIAKLMTTMTDDLRERALQWMAAHVSRVNQLEEAKKLIRKKAGIVETPWCGNPECGHKLEEEVNARVLGTPVDLKEKVSGNCIVCGKKAKEIMRTAVAY